MKKFTIFLLIALLAIGIPYLSASTLSNDQNISALEFDPETTTEVAKTDTGLKFYYKGGNVRLDNKVYKLAPSYVALTASNMNYIEVASTGGISATIVGFTSGRIPLYTVMTTATAILTPIDRRTGMSWITTVTASPFVGTGGATITGGTINLNATSNYAVNIGTGTTTSTVTVGGSGTQTIAVGTGAGIKTVALGSSNTTSATNIKGGSGGVNVNVSVNEPVNIGTGSSTGLTTIGGGSNYLALDTTNWGITSGGLVTLGVDLDVTEGGTGVSTLTDHGVLLGSGASDITAVSVGTNGQILVGVTTADPRMVTLSGDIASITTDGVVDFTTVIVEDGGTGLATLTDNSLVVGAGTGNVEFVTVGTDGQILVGYTSLNPVFTTLSGDISSVTTAGVVTFATLDVATGGTGATTFTDGGVILGATTGALEVSNAGTDGMVLIGVTGANPRMVDLSGDIASITTDGVVDLATVEVADGGTGAVSLTNYSVLIGSGTAAITPITEGTDGQFLIGYTTADPVFVTLTGDVSSVTTAGVVTLATLDVGTGGTGATSLTDHGVLVGSDATAITVVAVGTDGQVLVGVSTADPRMRTLTGGIASITTDGVVVTNPPNIERSINLPIVSFLTDQANAPALAINDIAPSMVWLDTEVTPALVTFKLPADYASAGAFKLLCSSSGTSTPNEVDFDVYINVDGSAFDSSATGQTPVAVGASANTTNRVVTLTPATDFDSLSAGEWITLRIWRDDVAIGVDALEVKGCDFYYMALQ